MKVCENPTSSKTLKKHWLEQLLRVSIFAFGKPYKTNGKWMTFGPKSENGLKKYQKSISFFTISHMADSPGANRYKTCRLLMLLEPF